GQIFVGKSDLELTRPIFIPWRFEERESESRTTIMAQAPRHRSAPHLVTGTNCFSNPATVINPNYLDNVIARSPLPTPHVFHWHTRNPTADYDLFCSKAIALVMMWLHQPIVRSECSFYL
ncbi:MAG: hypothetical protein PUP92_18845, partial [Rhizonema sp. PD38]|nr:hypothetical protein [Rhizonema sp. PD38]